jgi:multidrug transporter EmrE-like cation transporter
MTLRTALFLAITVLANSAGEICLTRAMKNLGEVKNFELAALFRFFQRAFRSGWMRLAIGLLAVGFFAFLALLSWADVSFVIPATASTYVVGGLGAKFLLGERLSPARWAGIALVSVGVALVCTG